MHQTPYKSLYRLLALSMTISTTLHCFLSSSPDDFRYVNCTQPFECGDPHVLGDLKYPFWGINRANYCGKPSYELNCLNNNPIITNSAYKLHVIGTNPQASKITVAMGMFLNNNLCPSTVFNGTKSNLSFLQPTSGGLFTDSSNSFLTILYHCPSDLGKQLGWSDRYSCSINNTSFDVHFVTTTVKASSASLCAAGVNLPILQETAQALDDNTTSLPKALDEGFEMEWFTLEDSQCKSCIGSGGQCGHNWTQTQFTCYCPDKPYPLECPQSKRAEAEEEDPVDASL